MESLEERMRRMGATEEQIAEVLAVEIEMEEIADDELETRRYTPGQDEAVEF